MDLRKIRCATTVLMSVLAAQIQAEGIGGQFDINDFYRPFSVEEITPANQQTWPYYKYVSMNWDDFSLHGTAKIDRLTKQLESPCDRTVLIGKLSYSGLETFELLG